MDTIRNIQDADYDIIINNLDQWWGGRKMTGMLPRLFFNYFAHTSFVIQDKNNIKGFLVGFISQVNPLMAYVHFVGVNPAFRQQGVGEKLYQIFFEKVKGLGVLEVQCVTSPVNEVSVKFHSKLGFIIKTGDQTNEKNISFHSHYDGPEEHRVILNKRLSFNKVNN